MACRVVTNDLTAESGSRENSGKDVSAPSKQRVVTAKELKGTEVAIDGVIYELTGFRHPGGNSINIFGGNDVTTQYKMIHPHHTGKQLEKMRIVGKIAGYKSEYLWDTEFEREVKREVFKIVRRGREFGTPGFFLRCAIYVGLLASLQYVWATSRSLTWMLAVALGVSKAFIGMNVQHDANHGAASRKVWVNDLLGFGADFIGGQKWLWMQLHWTHHAFTNNLEKDPDVLSAEPLMIWNDYPLEHPCRLAIHKFQGLYWIFGLSFMWLSTVFNPQVFDLRHRGADFVGITTENDFTVSRRKFAIAIRLFYIYMNIVCPLMHNGFSLATLLLIWLMGASESVTLSVLFQLSHNFEGSDRDPMAALREKGEPVCWFKAQVETSSSYGGMIAGMLTGGLNFQIEHHLFPRMCSAWYPYIAPTVREVCKKHGVKYTYYPWVWENFVSTCTYMWRTGRGSNWENPLSGKA